MQDLYLGEDLGRFLGLLRHRPVYLVVLVPRLEVVVRRQHERGNTGYGGWSVSDFDTLLRDGTPRLGLWVDSSELSVEETVDAVLRDLPSALVSPPASGG